ncbi:sodium-dependent glucose transporter 1-like protein [Dinothrombium tinctorium]|uniref:Sodium-dependent glucose transporter 1-like protein n=1 Tax=Dinothrombium tinctorium TaxID=1965070 RepID=A0A443RPX3_9ACAR|nr:sodium-dependent glucose transporter 1-like protein [Dinothrombium tinctorium]
MTFNVIPPTFNDLQTLFNVSLEEMSSVYTFRSSGYLFGAITVVSLPYCTNITQFCAVVVVNGISSGGSDVGTNVWLLNLFKEKSGPYIQALYFCFAIGTFIIPLLSAPFLSENNDGVSQVHYTFLITGLIVLISSLFIFAFFLKGLIKEPLIDRTKSWFSRTLCTFHRPKDNYTVVVVALASISILIYSGFEISYMQFMPTLVTKSKLNVSNTDAAYMNSAMNLAYTCFRGLSAIINMKISTEMLLYFDFAVLLMATIILLIFINTSWLMVLIGNIFMGVGFASIFPSILAFVEKHMPVTNFIGSIFTFSGGVMAIVYPRLIGKYIENDSSFVLYLSLASVVLTTLSFTSIYIFATKCKRGEESGL